MKVGLTLNKEFFLKKISLLLLLLILQISMYSVFPRHYNYLSSNNLILISYASVIDSILPSSDFNLMDAKRLLPSIFHSFIIVYTFTNTYFYLYSYQRKNQIVLDKRKSILKLFSNYFEGNIHKWRNHLSYI